MTHTPSNLATVSMMFVFAFGASIATTSFAFAGGVCAPHSVLVERLAATYGEHPSHRGQTQSEYTVEVFSSKDFDTWTVTVRSAGGPTCLVASGRGRAELNAQLADRG